jgi:hypothetical protein
MLLAFIRYSLITVFCIISDRCRTLPYLSNTNRLVRGWGLCPEGAGLFSLQRPNKFDTQVSSLGTRVYFAWNKMVAVRTEVLKLCGVPPGGRRWSSGSASGLYEGHIYFE